MLKYLEALCALDGVSGWEDDVRGYIEEKAKPHADELYTDVMGNLFVFKKGKKAREKSLMVCAHMDEIGLIIRDIDDKGYLKFSFVGGVDRRVAIGKRVTVGERKIAGVIGVKAVHLTTKDERKKVPKCEDLFIDIGADSKESALSLVSIGERAVFVSDVCYMGKNIKARALDDRIGCAVMLKLIEEELEYDTHFVFTVQEEVGLRGATVAAARVNPDFALVIESTTAADLPGVDGADKICTLSGGAVIGMMDRSTIYDRDMARTLKAIADENNISWQQKTVIAGGTDAGIIHKSCGGIPTASISAPVRYIHSPACVTSLSALDAVMDLARRFVNRETMYR